MNYLLAALGAILALAAVIGVWFYFSPWLLEMVG